jgi:uncharacterized OB-fold protein
MMDVQLQRPLPNPSPLTEPFWAAAREGRLVRPVCDACGRSFFTPGLICPHCLSEAWTYRTSSGRGTVYSSTVVHRPPSPALPGPYHLAIVDMEEGWHLLTNIVDATDTPVPIGTPVEVTWVQINDQWTFPAFSRTETKELQ